MTTTPVPCVVRRRSSRRGYTLLELVLALGICALLFTAVGTMLFAVVREDRFVQASYSAGAEAELAMRRIAYNLRTAQAGTIVVGTNTIATVTAPDNAHNLPNGAAITYALIADPGHAGQKLLVETDQRFSTTNNTLAHNVTAFSVTNSISGLSGVTDVYQVDLVLSGPPTIERHFQVYARN